MNSTGDRAVIWDNEQAIIGEEEAKEAVREAGRLFAEAQKKGASAFVVTPGKPARRIETFDPEADQIVIVPRVAGG